MRKLPDFPFAEVRMRPGGRFSLTLDGEPFPYVMAEDGISVDVGSRSRPPTVTVTLLVDKLDVLSAPLLADSDEGGRR